MGWLIGLLVDRGLSEKAARAASYIGLVLLILSVCGGVVAWIRHDAVADHQAKVQQRVQPANDKAASERANDAINNAKSQQELHDVIQAQPDQPIAPTSRALACERLRRAGRHPASCG